LVRPGPLHSTQVDQRSSASVEAKGKANAKLFSKLPWTHGRYCWYKQSVLVTACYLDMGLPVLYIVIMVASTSPLAARRAAEKTTHATSRIVGARSKNPSLSHGRVPRSLAIANGGQQRMWFPSHAFVDFSDPARCSLVHRGLGKHRACGATKTRFTLALLHSDR
jgi:hypothetical protein